MKSRYIMSIALAVAFCTLFILNESHGDTIKCWTMYSECKTRSENFCEQYRGNYSNWNACITGTKSLGCWIFYESCKANKGNVIGQTVKCSDLNTACQNKVGQNCSVLFSFSQTSIDFCNNGKGPAGCSAFYDVCFENSGKTLD